MTMTAKEELAAIRKLNESMFCHCPKCGHKHFKKKKSHKEPFLPKKRSRKKRHKLCFIDGDNCDNVECKIKTISDFEKHCPKIKVNE